MWQKLNRLDILNLEKARVQIVNIMQLASAAARSYGKDKKNEYSDWLLWDKETSSFVSNNFGKNEEINISLDIERLILSINGIENQKEHLVLSGMSYPMAFGWMSIKLSSFQLDSGIFNDQAPYELEAYLKPGEDLNSEDQFTYDQIVLNYQNAHYLLTEISQDLGLVGDIRIDPSNANMVLLSKSKELPNFGFSLGNRSFPEPYYFLNTKGLKIEVDSGEFSGIWNGQREELVIMSSDFITQNQDTEYQKLKAFFTENISKISKG